MKRNEGETMEAYRLRRSAANAATKEALKPRPVTNFTPRLTNSEKRQMKRRDAANAAAGGA